MFMEVKYIEGPKKEQLKYISDFGGFNELPKPYKKTDINNFWNYFFHWTPLYVEFKQVRLTERYSDPIYNTKIYYFNDKAFALVDVIGEILVFEIGCEHDWESQYVDGFLKSTCKKCNLKVQYAAD